jgi:hypothetical protein
MSWHLFFMGATAAFLLTTVIGSALGFWRIAPSASNRSQMLIRFGMAVAGVSCFATVLSSVLLAAGWRDRVHWELAADAGIAVLALGLLVAAWERDVLRRGATRQHLSQGHGDD